MNDIILGDDLGPRGKRRVFIATVVSLVVVALIALWVVKRFHDKGQLDWERWEPLTQWAVLKFLLGGQLQTAIRQESFAGFHGA